jgi:hypothetical protein
MSGATAITAATGPIAASIVPCVVGVLAAVVAYGRSRTDVATARPARNLTPLASAR